MVLHSTLVTCRWSSRSVSAAGPGDVQGRLEQSVGARRESHAGWVHPPLLEASHRGPLPWEFRCFPGTPGVPACPVQSVGKPGHEHCGLFGIRGGPSCGICCSKGGSGWGPGWPSHLQTFSHSSLMPSFTTMLPQVSVLCVVCVSIT